MNDAGSSSGRPLVPSEKLFPEISGLSVECLPLPQGHLLLHKQGYESELFTFGI